MMGAVKTVLSGLIGIRRKADHEGVRITPLQVVAAAVLVAALFVFTLIAVVRTVAG